MMKNDNNEAMDLSVGATNNGDNCDSSQEENEENSEENNPVSSSGLSVVRPEVLFGNNFGQNQVPPGMPPFLAPFLAAQTNAGNPSIKDAFQEVLKVFGFPPELAEVFAKNAQALQQTMKGDAPSSSSSIPSADNQGTDF